MSGRIPEERDASPRRLGLRIGGLTGDDEAAKMEKQLKEEKEKMERVVAERDAEKNRADAMARSALDQSDRMNRLKQSMQNLARSVKDARINDPFKAGAADASTRVPPARADAAGEGMSSTSTHVTQEPTAAITTMLDVPESLLYSQANLNPIVCHDAKYEMLLDNRRYRLASEKMNSASTISVEKLKHYFPLTTQCVDGGAFDGNGPEPEKPFAGF